MVEKIHQTLYLDLRSNRENLHKQVVPMPLDHAKFELQILENISLHKSQNPLKNISLEIGVGYLKKHYQK